MSSAALASFIDRTGGETWRWFAKVLSANDTGQTGSHQVGIYLPRDIVFALFPSIGRALVAGNQTAKAWIPTTVQEGVSFQATITWYESKVEGRVTGWG